MITDQALLTIADKLGIAATEIFSIMVAGQKWQAISDLLLGVGGLMGVFAAFVLMFGGNLTDPFEKEYTTTETRVILLLLFLMILFLALGATVVSVMAPKYAALKELLGMVVQN